MASEAEVDLVISTADALPDLQRELEAIIRAAEDGASDIDVEATLDRRNTVADLLADLDQIVSATQAAAPDVELTAELNTLDTLGDLLDALDDVIDIAEARAQAIELDAQLDANVAELDAEIAALVAEVEAEAPEVDIEVDIDRDGRGAASLLRFGKGLASVVGPLAKVTAGIGGAAVAASSLAPLLAGVVGAVSQVAPASALAVSGLLTLQLATNTVKLAMVGVGDAVKTAFDPEAKPEDLAKAMENLSPRARSFVTELSKMRGELKAIQQGVQENFFQGFAGTLHTLSDAVLPDVREALFRASGELNAMALGAADAATRMGKNGTLGKALDGSVQALGNLNAIPGQIVTGLLQIGAAAAPAFNRITQGAAGAATEISDKLEKAFDSGALEKAIDRAVEALKQLGRIAGNIFGGLGNIIDGFQAQGEGLFGTLEKVTQAFEDVTATQGFQDALKALSQTLSVVVATVLPILSQAIQALGPVFQALAKPVQSLVKTLGAGLSKIVTALGPVLVSLANVFGKLVEAASPIIDLFATLISAVLPALTPLFNALSRVLFEITPFIEQLAKSLAAELVPVFTALATDVLPKILPPLVELATKLFPIMTEIITQLAPVIAQLGLAFGELLVALAPVIEQIAIVIGQMVDELMPILEPLIGLLARVVSGGLQFISSFITGFLVPALKILVDFLKGDWTAAWNGVKDLAKKVADKFVEEVHGMRDRALEAFTNLARRVGEKLGEMVLDVGLKAQEMANEFIDNIKSLPQRAAESLANAGIALVQRGQELVQGFINGITSQLGRLRSLASELANVVSGGVAGALDIHSPSRVMMDVGQDTVEGFRLGIRNGIPNLRSELQGIASMAPSFALPNGQALALPQFQQAAPTVQVYLGNELINAHVDTRIIMANKDRDRFSLQGVRR